MNKYIPRVIDTEIDGLLNVMGAVLIEGCKWCGKSTTGRQHAKSILEFQNPDKKNDYEAIKNTRPSLFLDGEKPRMFDEWQTYPVVWDSIRMDVDHTGLKGQYILTGSARPAFGTTMHTGTGRIARVLMRPMSLYESGESNGKVSLKDIMAGKEISATNELTLEGIAEAIVRGGWPAAINTNKKSNYTEAREYLKSLLREEVKSTEGNEINTSKMSAVLRSLARNISTQVSNSTIVEDVKNNFDDEVSRPTLNSYIETLEKLYVIESVNATNLQLRSKTAMRTKPKKEFVDPSIAAAALEMRPNDLIKDLKFFGFLFENLCIRDLKIYLGPNNCDVSFYRDETNFEIDVIIRTQSGKWGAVEIKLGAGEIDKAAENLLKLKEKIDIEKCGEPLFLMVISGTNYSYKRADDVYVVSIGSLRD